MCRRPLLTAACVAVLGAPQALADAVRVDAYADLRLVHAPDERAWQDGGLGKTRYGGTDDAAQFAEAGLEITANLADGLKAFVGLRYEEHQRTPVDVMEAYLSYDAVSGAWRWGVKAGAFYAPISLENDQIGWASSWTITPSAINSWVGEELRTIGLEGRIEWRGDADRLSATGAIFGWNDPAGVLIADRGWALSDRPTGLFDKPRLPDAFAVSMGMPTPAYTPMFREMDDRAGWYAGISWAHIGWGRVNALYYDNRTDPTVVQPDAVGWRTKFWSAGLETQLAGFVIKAQGLTGDTEIFPDPHYRAIWEFRSAYLLVGRVFGPWRMAARGEVFEVRQRETYGGPWFENEYGSESGHAFTLGGYWTPEEWLQLGAEGLYISSEREQREILGDDEEVGDFQLQLSARLFY